MSGPSQRSQKVPLDALPRPSRAEIPDWHQWQAEAAKLAARRGAEKVIAKRRGREELRQMEFRFEAAQPLAL